MIKKGYGWRKDKEEEEEEEEEEEDHVDRAPVNKGKQVNGKFLRKTKRLRRQTTKQAAIVSILSCRCSGYFGFSKSVAF